MRNASDVLGWSPHLTAARAAEVGVALVVSKAARHRMAHDLPATVGTQLDWLSQTGFTDVDCFYKNLFFAVFAGWRTPTPAGVDVQGPPSR